MTSRPFFFTLLLAAAPASAQMKALAARPAVMPSVTVGNLSAPLAAPSAVLTAPALAPFSVPALSALPAAVPPFVPSAVPAVAVAARAARLAPIAAAVGDFAKLDLKSVPAASAAAAGETLFQRALGADAPALPSFDAPSLPAPAPAPSLAPSAAPSAPRTYLLSKPLRETVKLGPLALTVHALWGVAWELGKASLAWKATGSLAAAATVFAVEIPFSPVMVTVRSLGHLALQYWRRKLAVLKELAAVPGVRRVRVLTAGEVRFLGPLATRKDNTGFLFVDADGPLPESIGRFGAPIALGDLRAERVRLTLEMDGLSAAKTWTPSLQELLDGAPLPADVAAAWRDAQRAETEQKAAWKRLPGVGVPAGARIEATLLAGGTERPLGAVVEGPAVKKLTGAGRIDRLRAWLGRPRAPRAIPISDTAVARPGDALPPFWPRVWARLTGRRVLAGK